MQFNPVLLNISQIKTVHPKVLALNHGLNAGQLESLTLLKNEYKNSTFNRLQTLVKEPEMENFTPTPDEVKTKSTNIFANFILGFLAGDSKKLVKSKTIRQVGSQQITPVPSTFSERADEVGLDMKIEKMLSRNKFTFSPQPLLNIETPTLTFENLVRKDITNRLPQVNSSRTSVKKPLFANLKPSSSLSNFLKIEEERILESRMMRKAKLLETEADQLPSIKNKTKNKLKKKKKTKKRKLIKNSSKELLQVFSPYAKFSTTRISQVEYTITNNKNDI